jgi:hypothetical protein
MKCPICNYKMNITLTTPCFDCGDEKEEVECIAQDKPLFAGEEKTTFAEHEMFPWHKMILCDFCDADFGSYSPDY